jgi:ketosteroid isomerase-like protein
VLDHYCHCIDTGKPELLTDEVFAHDAVDDHHFAVWRGRDEIREAFTQIVGRFAGTAHVLGNTRVHVDGDTAHSRAYVTAWHWLPGGDEIRAPADFVVLGAYHDELRRDAPGWRIIHRRFRPLGRSALGAGTYPPFLDPDRPAP